jgi:colanic acid biosynthesis protein WcaH
MTCTRPEPDLSGLLFLPLCHNTLKYPEKMTNEKPVKLSRAELIQVVKNAPLASIDLIVKNNRDEILLGLRKNEPAKDYWFVPGGRILKNERIALAFERISKEELGIEIAYKQAEFLGVFEHFYPSNFAQKEGFTTHYVALAYQISIPENALQLPKIQHQEYKWLSKDFIESDEKVHPYTKAYFK